MAASPLPACPPKLESAPCPGKEASSATRSPTGSPAGSSGCPAAGATSPTLARWDRPIGTWLLLLPCWWGQALADALPDPWLMLLFAHRRRGDARCRLHHQRPRRPRLRPAGGAHPQPAAGGRPDRRRARRCCSSRAQCLVGLLVLAALNWHRGPGGDRERAAGRRLPVHEADHLLAAGVSGHHLQLGRAGGLRRGRREPSTARPCCSTPPASSGPWATTRIYAHQDKEDDALIGVRSTALLLGDRDARLAAGLLRRHPGAPAGGRRSPPARAPCSSWRWCRSPGCCCARSRGLRLDDAARLPRALSRQPRCRARRVRGARRSARWADGTMATLGDLSEPGPGAGRRLGRAGHPVRPGDGPASARWRSPASAAAARPCSSPAWCTTSWTAHGLPFLQPVHDGRYLGARLEGEHRADRFPYAPLPRRSRRPSRRAGPRPPNG